MDDWHWVHFLIASIGFALLTLNTSMALTVFKRKPARVRIECWRRIYGLTQEQRQ
jgi:hypothetical protein